jgi:tetratricopeptide (TPR) repeat protein
MRFLYLTMALLFMVALQSAQAQDSRLAQQYFSEGEYEKAAALYEELYKKNGNNDYYFSRYLASLIEMEEYAKGEDLLKKQIKKTPKKYRLYLDYGNLLERQYRPDEADAMYEKSIEMVGNDANAIRNLAVQFQNMTKYDLAIKTYEKGMENAKDPKFSYYLAELYRRKGDTEKMITQYLLSLEEAPSRLSTLKTQFQRYFSEDDFLELQTQLYDQIQEKPEEDIYPELLSWVFIQRKDYKGALRQAKALDMRMEENGGRVYQIARTAANDKDWDTAISGYEYIIENKGNGSSFYIEAKQESLRCKRSRLVEGYDFFQEELLALKQEYLTFLEEFGRSRTTAGIISELAELEALYLHDLDAAITLLDELIGYPMVNPRILANAKISLADYYLMQGEVWEATLLYSQVDKQFKDDLLGQEARYRNALLSYFAGDFEWAQTQFSVLKASTSKLIANDALDRSVFIMDNLALDTTAMPLLKFSEAELFVFQNRFDDAFGKLDSVRTLFPNHSLEDDVYYLKAQIYKKQRDYERAALMLQTIIDKYADGIRGDNAVFELAELHETRLDNPTKATELYEKIIYDYSGSTFSVEARKRYRRLLGEEM